ncbi:hypothetical protein OKW41_006567 [Paraburkholderia sp. UCT70]|uniref:hypothetical protein n=1 Tax=Paraburkholderia sp. UCT70 TaxID=2991068 RepID=UPI003D2127FA
MKHAGIFALFLSISVGSIHQAMRAGHAFAPARASAFTRSFPWSSIHISRMQNADR